MRWVENQSVQPRKQGPRTVGERMDGYQCQSCREGAEGVHETGGAELKDRQGVSGGSGEPTARGHCPLSFEVLLKNSLLEYS